MKSENESVQFFVISWTIARQAPTEHGILQEKILEWVAMPISRGSSQPRDQTQVSCTAGRFFTNWATREGCPSKEGVGGGGDQISIKKQHIHSVQPST